MSRVPTAEERKYAREVLLRCVLLAALDRSREQASVMQKAIAAAEAKAAEAGATATQLTTELTVVRTELEALPVAKAKIVELEQSLVEEKAAHEQSSVDGEAKATALVLRVL